MLLARFAKLYGLYIADFLLERILISSIEIMIDAEDSAATVHPEQLSVAREQVNEQATIGSNSELSLSPVCNLENSKRVIFSKKQ